MNKENVKKSFYVTPELADAWEEFHFPSKDYSPSAAAGMLLYLAADQPSLREALRKLATRKDVKKAIEEARKTLVRSVLEAEILKAIADKKDNAHLIEWLEKIKGKK